MKKIIVAAVTLIFLLSFLSGCAQAMSPVTGIWFTEIQAPYGITSNTSVSPKVGTGTLQSILGLVALGDASIETIARQAGIKKIHYVDYETRNILGIYAEMTVKVYGE